MSTYGGYDAALDAAAPSPNLSEMDSGTPQMLTSASAINGHDRERKRKRAEFDPDPHEHFYDPAYIQDQTRFMIDLLKNYTDENGSHIYEPFLSLPDRDAFADYYAIVKKPVSIAEVEAKLANDEYPSLQPARDDLNQMFNNAKHYNQNGSEIYNAAQKLQKALKVYWKGLTGTGLDALGGTTYIDSPAMQPSHTAAAAAAHSNTHPPPAKRGRPSNAQLEAQAAADPVKAWMQSTLKKLIDHEDPDGRPYSEFFMVLPPREVFPDYYQLIEQPIAFSQLQSKVKKGNYSSNYDGFIRDVSRVFQNAKTYNDESALVYDDALVLEKLFAKLQNSSPFKPAQPKVTLKFGPGGPKGSTPVPATAPALEQQDNHDQNLANGSYSVPSTVPGGDAPADAPWPSLASTGGVALPQRRTKKHAQIFLPPKRPASLSRHSSFDLVTAGPARSSLSRGASSKSDYAPTSQSGSGPLPPPVAQRVPKVLSGLGVGTSSLLPVFHIRTYQRQSSESSSTAIFLNGFLRQHSITVPQETVALDIVVSSSVAPIPSSSQQRWTIHPPAQDTYWLQEGKSDSGAISSSSTAPGGVMEPATSTQHHPRASGGAPKPKVSARARPGGTLIREEKVNPLQDGPHALSKFVCRLSAFKHSVSTFELSANAADDQQQQGTQVYRLFVLRGV